MALHVRVGSELLEASACVRVGSELLVKSCPRMKSAAQAHSTLKKSDGTTLSGWYFCRPLKRRWSAKTATGQSDKKLDSPGYYQVALMLKDKKIRATQKKPKQIYLQKKVQAAAPSHSFLTFSSE